MNNPTTVWPLVRSVDIGLIFNFPVKLTVIIKQKEDKRRDGRQTSEDALLCFMSRKRCLKRPSYNNNNNNVGVFKEDLG